MIRTWTARAGASAASLAALALASLVHAQASAPGRQFLILAERAPTVAAGRIEDVTRLDRSAWVATLRVERSVSGPPAQSLRIAWEELARPDVPRFAAGQQIVVVLEPLPEGSLWRQRLPQRDALAVAGRGDAYITGITARDLDLLTTYLAAPSSGAARNTSLAALLREASPSLAQAALARFEPSDGIDDTAATALLAGAADAQLALSMRRALLDLLARSERRELASRIEPLAQMGSPVEAEALIAIGTLSRGMPAARAEALLERKQPAIRAVGARFASGALAERRLPVMVRTDPSPEVRAAAARALASTRSLWGIDGALPGLADADPSVRAATAHALAALGETAIPALERTARAGGPQARGAITALSLAGPAGTAAVRRFANSDGDEALRDYARLALGETPHSH